MRKLVFIFTLFVGIVISQIPFISEVEAADYYVGTSNTTERDCYLMTDTIREIRHYSDGGRFFARLKMVRSAYDIQYLDYELEISTSGLSFSNSEGYYGQVTEYGTPIEYNMCQYIWQSYL